MNEIGFMQGRLSPLVNGKIQAFPWDHWREEFPLASELGIKRMEWTLDHERLLENPLMTPAGQAEILRLSHNYGIFVGSLTGDLFMQAPFWRSVGAEREQRLAEFDLVLDACAAIGIRFIVVPLVDNGAVTSEDEENCVIGALLARADRLRRDGLIVAFECDYEPADLARFIAKLPADAFGVNYDIGNSAALDYDSETEIAAYGARIVNVHIKDRVKGGTTVPLGTGNANLPGTMKSILATGYRGAFILQTARAADGNHAGALRRFRDMSAAWLAEGTPP
jgi:hexulose-6-phosphate isomerase